MTVVLTKEILKQCLPFAKGENIDKFLHPLNITITRYHIDTPERCAAFLAQLAHESGSFKYVREIHDGSNYEGRKDLGNIHPGDGTRFRGRGLIQITGRTNYTALEKEFEIPFTKQPERLEEPMYAAMSAGWFWDNRELNDLADKNNFVLITKRINGGTNGMTDRQAHWIRCKKVFGVYEVA